MAFQQGVFSSGGSSNMELSSPLSWVIKVVVAI
jgi:hypothetical protein